MSEIFDPEDLPILDLDLSNIKRFEASRFLDSAETIAAFLSETMKAENPQVLMHALSEAAKAKGIKLLAPISGISAESSTR